MLFMHEVTKPVSSGYARITLSPFPPFDRHYHLLILCLSRVSIPSTHSQGDLKKYRRAELKHGRVAMLGVVGAIWQEFSVLPGLGYEPTKNLFQAVADAPWLAILQVFVFVGIFDLKSTKYDIEQGRVPGDIGFDPLKLSKDGINEKWALSELKHGRLAMWAMAAILVQQLLVPDKSPLELTYEWSTQFH